MISESTVKQLIRDIPDFPAQGIMFRDITPVLQDAKAFREVIDAMCETVSDMNPDVIVGIESRGFVLGTPIAIEMGLGSCRSAKGQAALRHHRSRIRPGIRDQHSRNPPRRDRSRHARRNSRRPPRHRRHRQSRRPACGRTLRPYRRPEFLIELEFLHGRKLLQGYDVRTVVKD